jgi:ribonuclease D
MQHQAKSPGASLIASQSALDELTGALRGAERLAIDTEADSLHCYFEKLCLIQLSVPALDALVDPLAGVSLEPLFALLATKPLVFHGADYDLRMLRRAGNFQVRQIFDTMIAARLTGLTEFNLAALVQEYFGVALPKGSQKANWAKRPLSAHMIEYALNDTRYLLALAERLETQLRTLGRLEWFRQSCEKVVLTSSVTRERDLETAWRIAGSNALRGRASAVLRELWNWREAEAKAADRPPFHILRNEDLVEATRKLVTGSKPHFSHVSGSRWRRFLEAADRALAMPPEQWPTAPRRSGSRPSPEAEARFQELKRKRDIVASELRLDPALIAPKATLEALAADAGAAEERLLPWQRELLLASPAA